MIAVYVDGACGATNPRGAMGAAAIIEEDSVKIHEICEGYTAAEINSNNRAEYLALQATLEWLNANGYCDAPIIVYSDSQMLVSQMKGDWRIKAGRYEDVADVCLELLEDFGAISFEWIPRHMNSRADTVSKRALRKGQMPPPTQTTTTNDTF